MDNIHFACEELDEFYLSDEPESDDAAGNPSTCETQNTEKFEFHETQAKCGDVFVGLQGNFTFVCSVCRSEFEDFDSFGSHIKHRHLEIESEPESPMEYIFTEPLPTWDTKNVSLPLSRERTTSENPQAVQTQVESEAERSQLTINNSLPPNQHGENAGAKQINDTRESEDELDEKSSDDDYAPEEETCRKNNNLQNRKEYFCVHCGRTYITRRYFVAHNKKKHNIIPNEEAGNVYAPLVEPVKIVCKYCDKSFADQVEFKDHMRTHTGRYRFVCPFCQKTFNNRYSRDTHVNTHTGERPFKCTYCSKAFSHGTNLNAHIRIHLGIMKFSCDYCDRRFVQSSEKKLHERTHTGERPYQCEECGRRFRAHVQLMEHRKRHKNIKNYKCEVCSQSYYNSTLLKSHMLTHTGERPHVCSICSRAFARRREFRKHEMLHLK